MCVATVASLLFILTSKLSVSSRTASSPCNYIHNVFTVVLFSVYLGYIQ